jgi:hypothetical protein
MFKEAIYIFFVMVAVQGPKKPMHQVFMRQPGDTFHAGE